MKKKLRGGVNMEKQVLIGSYSFVVSMVKLIQSFIVIGLQTLEDSKDDPTGSD